MGIPRGFVSPNNLIELTSARLGKPVIHIFYVVFNTKGTVSSMISKKGEKENVNFPTRSKNLPATQGMLQLIRNELKASIQEGRSELKAEILEFRSSVDSRFERILQAVHHVTAEVVRVGMSRT